MAAAENFRGSTARTFLHGLMWLLAAVLCMLALEWLAHIQLRSHLDAVASKRLGMRLHSDSPHHWQGNIPADIVARKAFSAATSEFRSDGLHFQSGTVPVDVGMVISGNIDLIAHSVFQVDLSASQSARISLIVRETLKAPACSSETNAIPAGRSELSFDLSAMRWHCEVPLESAPQSAAMLRLHVVGVSGSEYIFHSALLQSRSTLASADLEQHAAPLLPSPRDSPAFDRALQRMASDPSRTHPALLQLPLDARVEQLLVARNRILKALPEAIIVPHGDLAKVSEHAASWSAARLTPAWAQWLGVVLLALALAALRWRPPIKPRLRAALELAGVLCAPLALIVGNRIGDNLAPPILAASTVTFVFALSLLRGTAPKRPGTRTAVLGWSVALFCIGIASAIGTALGSGITGFDMPGIQHASKYLVWAAIQQFLICVIVAGRAEILCGNRQAAILFAALVFAMLHSPNAMLMQLTFVGGLIWVWNWQRHRALLANIIAHAVCGLLLSQSLPADWLYSAEVSARYFLIGPS